MRVARSFVICAAAAAFITAGCEVRTEPAAVSVSGDVAVDEPQGAVIEGAGVAAIDVEPDPAQRVYVYDEGYPPGTYTYNGYYYYGGYRYPHDIFVNQYVQENIRNHKYVDTAQNRRLGAQIEQRHRTEFAKTKGVRQNRPAEKSTPAERPENRAAPGVENRAPAERPEDRAAPGVENRTAPGTENRTPADHLENRAAPGAENRAPAERPEVKTPPNTDAERPAKEAKPENKANPAKGEPKPGEEPKHDEQK